MSVSDMGTICRKAGICLGIDSFKKAFQNWRSRRKEFELNARKVALQGGK